MDIITSVHPSGGVNPVNSRSEFAGVALEVQKQKIIEGCRILKEHGITPKVFFAPSHTFDENTIIALQECSDIRIVSDTIANKPYKMYGMTFIPQQLGQVRNLPFNTVTFCYHPNIMKENDFVKLESFLKLNLGKFQPFPMLETDRKFSLFDLCLKSFYFARRK